MNDIDFMEIEALFAVIEKCVGHSGKYPGIMAEAQTRLTDINDHLRETQIAAAKEREAEAAAKAEQDAKAAEEAKPKSIPSTDVIHDPATMSTNQRRL